MSHNQTLFDLLRLAAYPLVAVYVREHGLLSAVWLTERLTELARREQEGLRDPDSDSTVRDVVRRVVAFCMDNAARIARGRAPKGFSPANQSLYDLACPGAKAHAIRLGREQRAITGKRSSPPKDALEAAIRADIAALRPDHPGVTDHEIEGMVGRLTTWFGRHRPGKRSRAPGDARRLTKAERVTLRASVAELLLNHRIMGDEKKGRARKTVIKTVRGKDGPQRVVQRVRTGDLSVRQAHARIGFRDKKVDGVIVREPTGLSLSAVHSAAVHACGHLHRSAVIDALRPTPRDLYPVLDEICPKDGHALIVIDDLASKLWTTPRGASARSMHRTRVREALADMEQAGLLHVHYPDRERVIISRGRRSPKDIPAFLAKAKVREIERGLVRARQGFLSDEVGQDAQCVIRVSADQAGDYDMARVAHRLGHEEAAFGSYAAMNPYVRKDTVEWCDRIMLAARFGLDHGTAPAARDVRRLALQGRADGLAAAWTTYTSGPVYAAATKGAHNALTKRYVDQIGQILGKSKNVDDGLDILMEAAASGRPGRRHTRPLPDRPARETRTVLPILPEAPKLPIGTSRVYPARAVAAHEVVTPLTAESLHLLTEYAEKRARREEAHLLSVAYFGPATQGREIAMVDSDGVPYLKPDGTPMKTFETEPPRTPDPERAMDVMRDWLTRASELYPRSYALDRALGDRIRKALKAAGVALRQHGVAASEPARSILEDVLLVLGGNRPVTERLLARTGVHLAPFAPTASTASEAI